MAVVATHIDVAAALTVHIAHGVLTTTEIRTIVDTYYRGPVTPGVLWHFGDAALDQIAPDDIWLLASLTRHYCQARPGGKTALVFAREVDYGIGRMFQLCSAMSDAHVTFRPFRDLATALAWVCGGPAP